MLTFRIVAKRRDTETTREANRKAITMVKGTVISTNFKPRSTAARNWGSVITSRKFFQPTNRLGV